MNTKVELTFRRKVANNRGNCRIWIEGAKLLQSGINAGDRFDWSIVDNAIVLVFNDASHDKRKVSGNAARPIIDINSEQLNSILGNDTHYNVTASDNRLIITQA
jgi:DNA (cytosine-5)-methyltransferase 1